ncbi:MFS transporter [Saxibacter everestensis]|uniref:MFS transporter n=1 Tax=Saxibacter everestensis TaxID=2909229 RepID=A0ABY8QSB5_9MICO|nr:MFS transporter [Brevibacteriaceae bacterium ZFBP1038]
MNISTAVKPQGTYRSLINLTGGSYFPIAFLGRLPFAMSVVGVLTLVATVRDSYSEAGITSGVVGVGSAIFGPFVGALADRLGQRMVVLWCAIANTLSLVLIVVLVYVDAHLLWILTAAFAVGITAPQVGSMVRARWLSMIPQKFSGAGVNKPISAAMSYESMADELVFVFGPVLVGFLAFLISPGAPIVIAAGLTLVFTSAFALHRTARFASGGIESRAASAPGRDLLRPQVLLPVLGMAAVGLFFGSTLTSLTAFMGVYAEESQTGMIYGAMGIGSAVMAMAVVLLPESFSFRRRWIIFAAVAVAGAAVMPWVSSLPAMVAVLLLTGCGIGPSLVTLFSIGSKESPRGRTTTVMTMLTSGVIVGQAVSSAIVGSIAESGGHHLAYFAVLTATALLLVLGVINALLPESPRRTRTVGQNPV